MQAACPGHTVSAPAPASRYALRFIRERGIALALELWIVQGKGSFGRQVADGAQQIAGQAGAGRGWAGNGDAWPCPPGPWRWCPRARSRTMCRRLQRAACRRDPPRLIFSVAAGVREFAGEVDAPELGIGCAGDVFRQRDPG